MYFILGHHVNMIQGLISQGQDWNRGIVWILFLIADDFEPQCSFLIFLEKQFILHCYILDVVDGVDVDSDAEEILSVAERTALEQMRSYGITDSMMLDCPSHSRDSITGTYRVAVYQVYYKNSLENQGVFNTFGNSRTPHLLPGKKCQHLVNTLENFSNTAQNGFGV